MHRPVLVTPPTERPVTLAEAKAQCRVDHHDEDALIDGLIRAATDYLDGWTGILARCLVTQTWRQDFDDFCSVLRLPLFPVASITSVTYLDVNGASQTISAGNYALRGDERGAYVEFDEAYAYPGLASETGPRVSVTYVAGTAVASVPYALKQAILLDIEQRYDGHNDNAAAIAAKVTPYRRVWF